MSDVQISVVMGVRNEADHIEELLTDIIAQDLSKDQFELIIADGESDDGTDEIVARWIKNHPDAQATLLANAKRWQYPGVNMCIRQALGKAVLVLDGHARIPPDFLSKNLEALESTGAGVVGGFWNTQGIDSIWGKAIEGALSSWFGVGSARFRIAGEPGSVDVVPFGCFRTEVFQQAGLYREELGSNADLDVFQRVRQAGFMIYLDAQIQATYFARPNLRSLARQMFRNGRWFLAHLKATRPRHLAPLVFLLSLIGLPLLSLAYPPLIWVWLGIIGTYVVLNVISAIRIGINLRSVASGASAAVVFPLMHISYGLGWLVGFVSPDVWQARKRGHEPPVQLNDTPSRSSIPS